MERNPKQEQRQQNTLERKPRWCHRRVTGWGALPVYLWCLCSCPFTWAWRHQGCAEVPSCRDYVIHAFTRFLSASRQLPSWSDYLSANSRTLFSLFISEISL